MTRLFQKIEARRGTVFLALTLQTACRHDLVMYHSSSELGWHMQTGQTEGLLVPFRRSLINRQASAATKPSGPSMRPAAVFQLSLPAVLDAEASRARYFSLEGADAVVVAMLSVLRAPSCDAAFVLVLTGSRASCRAQDTGRA